MNRDRNTLRGFFKKGLIPTEDNFGDLIDSTINQIDDGISKPPNDPLRINASDSVGTVLKFYQNATADKPAWALSLNSGGTKPGLNVSSGTGVSRLFIDNDSGFVGIGTPTPSAPLDIVSNHNFPHLRVGAGKDAPWGAFLSLDAEAISGNNYLIFSTGTGAGEGVGSLIFKNQTSGKVSLTILPQGGVRIGDRLDVNGELFQHVPMIQCVGDNNWIENPNHPVQRHFKVRLTGQPRGTILQAMADLPGWENLFWIGWVASDGKARIMNTSNLNDVRPKGGILLDAKP